jgi:calcium-dependent protein kinase
VYKNVYDDTVKAEKMCNDLFDSVDYNRSGKIDFTGSFFSYNRVPRCFLKLRKTSQQSSTGEGVSDVRQSKHYLISKDSNGQISRVELQQIMGGIDIDEEQWKHILEECDKNGDG